MLRRCLLPHLLPLPAAQHAPAAPTASTSWATAISARCCSTSLTSTAAPLRASPTTAHRVPACQLSSGSAAAGHKIPGLSSLLQLGKLNHIAIAASDLPGQTALYRDVLGCEVSAPLALPEHGVTVVFVQLDNTKVGGCCSGYCYEHRPLQSARAEHGAYAVVAAPPVTTAGGGGTCVLCCWAGAGGQIYISINQTEKVELLEPLGERSPIAGFLAKNPAGGMHHVCYEVCCGTLGAQPAACS